MNIIQFFNSRIKRMGLFDLKLAQIAAALVMWIVIKLFPVLTKVDYIWLVIPIVLISIRLFYVVFAKKEV
ncbi:MAG: hypothetical protein RAP70_09400 [Candidatus Celaenobacter antarcticus]|nr:hypothetical protein [Candidatus Celaenobacter antarcticus]